MPSADAVGPADASPQAGLRRLAAVAYLIALALLGPFFSAHIGAWSGEAPVGSMTWRYGIYGVVVNTQFYLMIALVLAAAAAVVLSHARMLTVVMVVTALFMLFLLAGAPVFVLDTLQMRKSMSRLAFQPYRQPAMQAALQAGLAVPVFLVILIGSFRARRAMVAARSRETRTVAPPIIGGR